MERAEVARGFFLLLALLAHPLASRLRVTGRV